MEIEGHETFQGNKKKTIKMYFIIKRIYYQF